MEEGIPVGLHHQARILGRVAIQLTLPISQDERAPIFDDDHEPIILPVQVSLPKQLREASSPQCPGMTSSAGLLQPTSHPSVSLTESASAGRIASISEYSVRAPISSSSSHSPSPASAAVLNSLCIKMGAQPLNGRAPSRALMALAAVVRRSRRIELSAVPLPPLAPEDAMGPTAFMVTVGLAPPSEEDLAQTFEDGRPVVHPSEAARKLFWHMLYGKNYRLDKDPWDSSMCPARQDPSPCGFLGCGNACVAEGGGSRGEFRLDKVFASCNSPTIPPFPSPPSSLGQFRVLPDEAFEAIARWLTPPELAALGGTCPAMRRIVTPFVPALKLRLYKHQAAAIWRMMERERGPRPQLPPPLFCYFPAFATGVGFATAPHYVDMATGAVFAGAIDKTVPDCRGGLFCDEPGLGKTITALALILKTLGQQAAPPPGYDKLLPQDSIPEINYHVVPQENRSTISGECREDMQKCESSPNFPDVVAIHPSSISNTGTSKRLRLTLRISSEQSRQCNSIFRAKLKPFFYRPSEAGRYLPFGFDEVDALQRKARGLSSGSRRSVKTPDFHNPATGKGSLPIIGQKNTPIYLSGATLVVVPPMLLSHWTDQIAMHVQTGALRVLAVKHARQIPPSAELAFNYDVVIMSFKVLNSIYGAMREEAPSLLCVRFLRVILDEGHRLGASRAGISNFSRVCESLKAERRWIMTGTPTPNTPDTDVRNLHPLLQFVRDESYGRLDKDVWIRGIQRPYEAFQFEALVRLRLLLQRVVIRSAKDAVVNLPKCVVKDVLLDFTEEAATCYNELVVLARRNLYLCDWMSSTHVESFLNPKNAKLCMEFLENLRSSCNFGGIIQVDFSMVDLGESLDLLYREAMRSRQGLLKLVRPDDVHVYVPSKDRWWASPVYAPTDYELRQSTFLSIAAKEALAAKAGLLAAQNIRGGKEMSGTSSNKSENGEFLVSSHSVLSPEEDCNNEKTANEDISVSGSVASINDLEEKLSVVGGIANAGINPDGKEASKMSDLSDRALCLPRKHALSKTEGRIEVRGAIREIGYRIIRGSTCAACCTFCRLPILSTCGHVVCIDCFASNRLGCVVPNCCHEYELDKDGIPEKVIEMQPSVNSDTWKPDWENSKSTKIQYLLKRLDEIQEQTVWSRGEWRPRRPKVIIFSQFHMHHLLLAMTLKNCDRYRDAYVELFWNERELMDVRKSESVDARASRLLQGFIHDEDKFILLLETRNGSVGLDLSFVEYIFLLEPIWDTSLEQQVIARAHRLGAKHTVHVERLAMRGSVEENMLHDNVAAQSGVQTYKKMAESTRRSNLLKTLESVRGRNGNESISTHEVVRKHAPQASTCESNHDVVRNTQGDNMERLSDGNTAPADRVVQLSDRDRSITKPLDNDSSGNKSKSSRLGNVLSNDIVACDDTGIISGDAVVKSEARPTKKVRFMT